VVLSHISASRPPVQQQFYRRPYCHLDHRQLDDQSRLGKEGDDRARSVELSFPCVLRVGLDGIDPFVGTSMLLERL
jgi:hypothetical protein